MDRRRGGRESRRERGTGYDARPSPSVSHSHCTTARLRPTRIYERFRLQGQRLAAKSCSSMLLHATSSSHRTQLRTSYPNPPMQYRNLDMRCVLMDTIKHANNIETWSTPKKLRERSREVNQEGIGIGILNNGHLISVYVLWVWAYKCVSLLSSDRYGWM
jgi:hypothetical protein